MTKRKEAYRKATDLELMVLWDEAHKRSGEAIDPKAATVEDFINILSETGIEVRVPKGVEMVMRKLPAPK